ncbi:ZIP family metal transporter, partial [Candidatus Microgenomates bacterium]|nr:ZIP family metal transporter [Candidatus Microgenomates bacterium]
MERLILIIISTFFISLGALVGVFTFSLKQEKLSKILLFMVSLSAGALMGGAFLHLLPEATEKLEAGTVFIIVLISFILFFL